MSTETKLTLPWGTRIRDVADVIAISLGLPRTWSDCSGVTTINGLTKPTDQGWVDVPGIKYLSSDTMPHYVTIVLGNIDQELYGDGWDFGYFFEGESGPTMLGGFRAQRIALHRRLASFFGGTVDYNDCDLKDVDFRRKPPAWLGKAGADEHFHAMQMAKWNLKPISREEINHCERFVK